MRERIRLTLNRDDNPPVYFIVDHIIAWFPNEQNDSCSVQTTGERFGVKENEKEIDRLIDECGGDHGAT